MKISERVLKKAIWCEILSGLLLISVVSLALTIF